MEKLVSAQNVVKAFGEGGERRNVLDGLSVEIGAGEFVAVMGPSGSGKSTLMYALGGMDGVDSGRVRFDGRDLSGLGEDELADLRRKSMGFVFQQPTLLRVLDILDNIILPALRDAPGRAAQLKEKARGLMETSSMTRRSTLASSGKSRASRSWSSLVAR